jgi:hypothetical protein
MNLRQLTDNILDEGIDIGFDVKLDYSERKLWFVIGDNSSKSFYVNVPRTLELKRKTIESNLQEGEWKSWLETSAYDEFFRNYAQTLKTKMGVFDTNRKSFSLTVYNLIRKFPGKLRTLNSIDDFEIEKNGISSDISVSNDSEIE